VTAGSAASRWLWVSYTYCVLVAAILGYFLVRIPIQINDSFTTLLALDQPFVTLMRDQFLQAGYLRPGMWAELKLVYDLSAGHYFYWFRLTQAAQALAILLLFVRVLRPQSATGAAAVPVALTMLIGSHTFAWTVREAFPINTFLTIVACGAAAVNLSFARHRWWIDALAALLFVISALTVESGLLIAVIFVGGYLVGLRGVSRRGISAVCALTAGYFVLRFVILNVGVPGLVERDSGLGFVRYTPTELSERFGSNPLPFYVYNVIVSTLSVLFAEPRDGVFRLTRSLISGKVEWPLLIATTASTLTTILLIWYAWLRRRMWLRREFTRDDQIVLLFVLVLAANATISYAYTKDVILSPAGFFFAAAGFVAVRTFLEQLRSGGLRPVVGAIVLFVMASAWAVRAVGLHAGLDQQAGKVREQWAYVDDWLARVTSGDLSPKTAAVKQQLQDDAVRNHPPRPRIQERWTRLFEVE
jgi:hypothetical protein